MDSIKALLKEMKHTFSLATMFEAFFGGLLLSLLIITPVMLLIINLAFLYVAYVRLYVVLGVVALAVFASIWTVTAYTILRLKHPSSPLPLETLRWIEALIISGLILIIGIPIALVIVANAY